mmetsp:Transcript_24191/g.52155  ORF Transcript_24191/g.52155 Transcript_24191/m.52155 type:complete len:82 (+) Transcript_24191:405-650(+)
MYCFDLKLSSAAKHLCHFLQQLCVARAVHQPISSRSVSCRKWLVLIDQRVYARLGLVCASSVDERIAIDHHVLPLQHCHIL